MCLSLLGQKVGNVLKTFFFFNRILPETTENSADSSLGGVHLIQVLVPSKCWFPSSLRGWIPATATCWSLLRFCEVCVTHVKTNLLKKHPCTQKKYLKFWVHDLSTTISLRRLGSHRYLHVARQSWINWVGNEWRPSARSQKTLYSPLTFKCELQKLWHINVVNTHWCVLTKVWCLMKYGGCGF